MSALDDDVVPLIDDREPLPVTEWPDPFARDSGPRVRPLCWRTVAFLAAEQLADLQAERRALRESVARVRAALRAERAELQTILERARERSRT